MNVPMAIAAAVGLAWAMPLGAAGPPQGDYDWKAMDTDGDGRVTRAEWLRHYADIWDHLPKDADGTIASFDARDVRERRRALRSERLMDEAARSNSSSTATRPPPGQPAPVPGPP